MRIPITLNDLKILLIILNNHLEYVKGNISSAATRDTEELIEIFERVKEREEKKS